MIRVTYRLVLAICFFSEHDCHFQFFFQQLNALFIGSDTVFQHLGTSGTDRKHMLVICTRKPS